MISVDNSIAICFICYSFFPYQGNSIITPYIKYLLNKGYNIILIVATNKKYVYIKKLKNINVYYIPVNPTKKFSLNFVKFCILSSRIIKRNNKKVNIKYIHVIAFPFSFILKLMLFSLSAIWNYDIRTGPIDYKTTKIHDLKKLLIKLESLFYNNVFIINKDVFHYIFGDSYYKNIIFSPFGIDFSKYDYDVKKYNKKNKIFIYVGSLDKIRNIDMLIKSFFILEKEIKNVLLLIVGMGNQYMYIRNLISKYNLEKKIILIGYVDHKYIPYFLKTSYVGISYIPMISSYFYQPPIKTLEYLASGLPVIATNTPGNKLYVRHDFNGLIINDDLYSLYDAMKYLCNNENKRNYYSKNARKSVIKYQWKYILPKSLGMVYKDL